MSIPCLVAKKLHGNFEGHRIKLQKQKSKLMGIVDLVAVKRKKTGDSG